MTLCVDTLTEKVSYVEHAKKGMALHYLHIMSVHRVYTIVRYIKGVTLHVSTYCYIKRCCMVQVFHVSLPVHFHC